MTSSNLVLWHVQNTASFFLIPADLSLPAGSTVLEDFNGNSITTALEFLQPYAITFHKAQEFLETKWKDSVEVSKKAWTDLSKLAVLTGKSPNVDDLKKSLSDAFASADASVKQAFDRGKQAVENLVQSVQGGDPKTPEEQKTVLKRIFEIFPAMGNVIDEKTLEEAVKDPEAWAKKLEDEFLPQEKKDALKKSQEKLAKDIQESIASALRKAGITPSADFDKKNDPGNTK